MKRVSFVVPVHGREDLTRVCLRQLARTCEQARRFNVQATAVVVGDDTNMQVAEDLGFDTVRRNNDQVGRKFNDGYQYAADPEFGGDADYVVPCGSDDWIDPQIFRLLPRHDTIGVFQRMGVVNADCTVLARARVIGYAGGLGPRIIPRHLIALAGYRPADEHLNRAIDGSTYKGIFVALGKNAPRRVCLDVHDLQIVDWKSPEVQLNPYEKLRGYFRGESADVWGELSDHYPADALDEMREITEVAAAA